MVDMNRGSIQTSQSNLKYGGLWKKIRKAAIVTIGRFYLCMLNTIAFLF